MLSAPVKSGMTSLKIPSRMTSLWLRTIAERRNRSPSRMLISRRMTFSRVPLLPVIVMRRTCEGPPSLTANVTSTTESRTTFSCGSMFM